MEEFQQTVEEHLPNHKFKFSKNADKGYFEARHETEKIVIRFYPFLYSPWWEICWVGGGYASGDTLHEAKSRLKVEF